MEKMLGLIAINTLNK